LVENLAAAGVSQEAIFVRLHQW